MNVWKRVNHFLEIYIVTNGLIQSKCAPIHSFNVLICHYYDCFNSFKSVMTVMPAVAHCSRRASKSNMFVCPRYNTGRILRSVAMANTASAGDGF